MITIKSDVGCFIFVGLIVSSCQSPEIADKAFSVNDTAGVQGTFDYENCPKAWSLEEAMAAPDSFCMLFIPFENELSIVPPEIEKMPHLIDLDMHGHRVSEIPAFLKKLRRLDLSSNKLTSCPQGIENLMDLEYLCLDYNAINELCPAILGMKNLRSLSLFENNIRELPPEFFGLTKLERLALSENEISHIPAAIGNLKNLQYLYLYNNPLLLEDLPDEMADLSRLKGLFLGYSGNYSSNGPEVFPSFILNLDSLTSLSLTHLDMAEIPSEISQLQMLEELDLTGNNLSTLPEEIKNLPHLKSIVLAENNFSPEEQQRIKSWFGEGVSVIFEWEYGC